MSNDLLIGSKDIYDRAIREFKPKASVFMLSGGDDSLTTYHVARELGIKFDFVIHGNTRTGIQETTDFARNVVAEMGDKYLEADAGDSYVNYVLRKGFFGAGLGAHAFSYHRLKQEHFERVVSHSIRQRQRGFPIIFINGGRRSESENRMKRFADPLKVTTRRKNDMWVNLINDWHKQDCKDYLEGNGIKRNPVSINICRSGECMCGTMQSKGDRQEAAFFYPEWEKQLAQLEKKAIELHGFGWGESKSKEKSIEEQEYDLLRPVQLDLFQPMCIGCTRNVV